jgi:hypothetical protein
VSLRRKRKNARPPRITTAAMIGRMTSLPDDEFPDPPALGTGATEAAADGDAAALPEGATEAVVEGAALGVGATVNASEPRSMWPSSATLVQRIS